jgi:hypothetical protein
MEHSINGIPVQAVIWRAWRAWGAERIWGSPVEAPVADGRGGWSQLFENGLLQYHPNQSATTGVVQVGLLGRAWLGTRTVAPETPSTDQFFPETHHAIGGIFEQFWNVYGGGPIFGLPLTGEERSTDESGNPIITQTFERAQLIRPAASDSMAAIKLRPLGRWQWAQMDEHVPTAAVEAR